MPQILKISELDQEVANSIAPDWLNFNYLDLDETVFEITSWFRTYFHPPADPAEGVAVSPGGPFSTKDIIESFFPGVDEITLSVAIGQLDQVSDVWMINIPRGTEPSSNKLGGIIRLDPSTNLWVSAEKPAVPFHQKMVNSVRALERTLERVPGRPEGIGHNNPPEPIEEGPLDDRDHQELSRAIKVLTAQPVTPRDEGRAANDAAATIATMGQKIREWLGQRAELFTDEAIKEMGKQFGKWGPRVFWLLVLDRMFHVTETVAAWLKIALGS